MDAEIIFQYIIKNITNDLFANLKCLVDDETYEEITLFDIDKENILISEEERELSFDVDLEGYIMPEDVNEDCVEFIKVQKVRIGKLSERKKRSVRGLASLMVCDLLYKVDTSDDKLFISDYNCMFIISRNGNVIMVR